MINKDKLLLVGIEFKRTALSEPVFVHTGEFTAEYSVRPQDWTIKQLRAMADFMEDNKDEGYFDDGSGKPFE